MTDALEVFGVVCSISDDQECKVENATLLVHQEDSNGNYLHDLKYFQWHLRKEELIIIVHDLSGRARNFKLGHPVLERAFYSTVAHKRALKEEYGVEPWTIVQKLGDAVFVPAGCPHQISYLQSCTSVGFNFVAPESIGECIRLSSEYRRLPQNHRCKEDKLQVKQMTLHAVSQAVEFLEPFITNNATRNHVKAPHVDSDVQETRIPLRDLVFMKQEMETKIATLQKHGHLVQPHMRAYLQKSIQNFLVRIDKEMIKNFVGTFSSSSSS